MRSCLRRFAVVGPAVLLAAPLVSFSFQRDEMRNIYRDTLRFGTVNPLRIAGRVLDGMVWLVRIGNFRPLGRFADHMQRVSLFEAAEATGLAPNFVLGLVRLAMVGALALVAVRFIARLMSSGGDSDDPAGPGWARLIALGLAPAIIAVCLVAGGRDSPIVYFPFLFLGSAIVVLAVPQMVARDRDFAVRRVKIAEWAALGLLGAATTMILEVVYVALPLTLVFIAARAMVTGVSWRRLMAMAVARRFAALTAGFLAVFVPVRWMIEGHCRDGDCYIGSDLVPRGFTLDVFGGRMATGAPFGGWAHNADIMRSADLRVGLGDLVANPILALALLGAVGVAVAQVARIRWRGPASAAGAASTPGDAAGPASAAGETARPASAPGSPARAAAGLGLAAACLIVLPGAMIAMSRLVQRDRWPIGYGWRDTVLVQIGWAVGAVAVVLVLADLLAARSWAVRRIGMAALAAVVCLGLAGTLLANVRLAQVDRSDPLAVVTNAIAAAAINFDHSEAGNERRCELIDAYTEFLPDPRRYNAGANVGADLDSLMTERRGRPFCDRAAAPT